MRPLHRLLVILAVLLLLPACIHRSGMLTDSDSKIRWSNTVLLSKAKMTGTTAEYEWAPDGPGRYRVSESGEGEDSTEALRAAEVIAGAAVRALAPVLAPYLADVLKTALAPTSAAPEAPARVMPAPVLALPRLKGGLSPPAPAPGWITLPAK